MTLPRFHLRVKTDVFLHTPRRTLALLAERNGIVVKWYWPRFWIRRLLLERVGGGA